ncbi:ABC transporter ATP-binding protein [Metamycoplasma canadense]|uniref:ABC transporter ATP-binding protein n=1 Tax=Metamycoplasma canadense TaxID=29554 RepID=A0A077L6W3_9BACT|nr:ABC transporter ATP-binding protein [Metamycoplasma canadense]BAP39762.1 ABC transporter ATP-binding protein [Metamycoplasma canadense]
MKKIFKTKKSFLKKWSENKQMFFDAKNKSFNKPCDDVAISIQHLSVIFKTKFQTYKKAVDDLSFDVKKGQFHGFIGNNGAGKTTTIRSILGFYPSFIGKIYINGIDSNNAIVKSKIGYIPEISIFPTTLSAKEYLYSFAEISKIPKEKIKSKIEDLINKFGFNISDFDKSPAFMSSGQKKSISLMQALLNDPEILILDEPAANLDPSARIVFFDNIKKLQKEGITILISSHILDELEKYIDSYTVLSNGKLLDSGLVKDKIRNAELNTKITFSNNAYLIEKFLKDNNINYKLDNNELFCDLKDPLTKQKLIKEITRLSLEIYELKANVYSLNSLYFEKK